MHSLVRRYLKSAFAFLVVGLALGAWFLARRELGGAPPSPREVSAHTHVLLVGFVMTMIAGVALWIFPRPAAGDTRYRPGLAVAAWWCLAPGTALRVIGELVAGPEPGSAVRTAIVGGGLGQVVGLALVFWTLLPRIRAAGSAQREAKGERF
ncbi:MAG: cbb3-type cytochrome c oxidase subunit I [Gemmatimonadetes bacterium]|nr:cbb3-type cytochrome c oxidase subunit I [Gemmatimonadota bacterium]